MTRETRTLPALAAGPDETPFVILSWSEVIARDTTWNEHSHGFHELLWNERGASTVAVTAVIVSDAPGKLDGLRAEWDRWSPGVRLEVLDGPSHTVVRPD